MSHAPRTPLPAPFRYPCPTLPIPLDKTKPPSTNLGPGMPAGPPPIPNTMPMPPFMPPRMFNPYFGGYNMFQMPQMPPYPPYMPLMRNPPPTGPTGQNSKMSKEQEERMMPPRPYFGRPMPPFFNPSMFMPPPFPSQLPPPDKELLKKLSKTMQASTEQPAEKPEKKEMKAAQSSSSQTPVGREDSKPKNKEPRHADVKQYEPELPKKKRKKEVVCSENSFHRETREKKESIERVMDLVMRERPLRDRVIKIGREYQAFIPESFVNEFQYNLKIKLQKKQNLLSRLVPMRSG